MSKDDFLEKFKVYLPKYLSAETEKKLYEDLNSFPDNIDDRFYSDFEIEENIIYQGDGIKELNFINLPDIKVSTVPCIIISNTCDIDLKNKRKFDSNIIYCPIIPLENYRNILIKEDLFDESSILSHIDSIKKQFISQILYLPESKKLRRESIVFFDRIISCDNKVINREILKTHRIFSLSQYGHYIFLFKLSLHFTRIRESVDRKY